MGFSLATVQDWYWRGTPVRRAFTGLLITVLLAAIWAIFDRAGARVILVLGLGWDAGGYGMDKAYVRRLSRQ